MSWPPIAPSWSWTVCWRAGSALAMAAKSAKCDLSARKAGERLIAYIAFSIRSRLPELIASSSGPASSGAISEEPGPPQ
ncbi:MAG: hypothetical protein JST59_06050 [Actinobacteria bacterium]|nr:hypothetical protein [Actinomycetota bacterium]